MIRFPNISLRKRIGVLAISGLIGISSATIAKAQLTFSVDTFTTDSLVITLPTGTSLSGSPNMKNVLAFLNADTATTSADPSYVSWILTNVSGSYSGGNFGGIAPSSLTATHSVGRDFIWWTFDSNLVSGSSLTAPLTVSFQGTGAFNPSAISNLALWWSDPIVEIPATFQSSGPAETGGGSAVSAVPEPTTFTLILGLCFLGVTVTRRRISNSGRFLWIDS